MKIKNSKQREAILEALNAYHCHPTVDEIYHLVRKKYPRISLATVYRNLELLHRQGKLQKVENAGCPARYDCDIKKHFHIKCNKCGRIGDVMIEKKLEDYIDLQNAAPDFTVTDYRIDFFGFCPQCKESAT